MSRSRRYLAIVLLVVAPAPAALGQDEDWLDRLGASLSWANDDGSLRARVSGSLELDLYHTPEVRADLRFSDEETLFAPRLCLFLDGQAGTRTYGFAQVRIDTGFDPTDESLEARFDEWALRLAVLDAGHLNLQAGKFATVVGAWTRRHHAWENPFVTAPLVYEGLTPMWDRRATVSIPQVLRRAHVVPLSPSEGVALDKHQRLPIVWGPVYATGAAAAGTVGRFDYAFEVKNAALCARPESWEPDERPWDTPAFGARLGWRPNVMWDLGLSAARGTYLTPGAADLLPPDTSAHNHRQDVLALDAGFAHRHLQVWAEIYGARFTAPGVDDLDTLSWYIETKYKFTPRLFGAVRVNQQLYADVDDPASGTIAWGRETWRLDLALTVRFTPHVQVKVQYSPQREEPSPEGLTHAFAAQFNARF